MKKKQPFTQYHNNFEMHTHQYLTYMELIERFLCLHQE